MTLATPALLFGAITVIMLAYTNRFSFVVRLVRDMHARKTGEDEQLDKKQLPILRRRLKLIQAMQALGVGSFVLCTLSMLFILAGNVPVGEMVFAFGVVCLMCSLVLSLWEVLLSTKAINYILDDFDKRYR